MSNSEEWPKEWDEITGEVEKPNIDTELITASVSTMWAEYSKGMRGYNGTLYVTETIGRETEEDSDLWMPIEVYMERTMKRIAEEVKDS